MTNRMKPIIREIIGGEQSSFVPGRQITDNVLTYQEVIHSMRKKTRKKGIMLLKIDLEKAYDRCHGTLSATRLRMLDLVLSGFGILWGVSALPSFLFYGMVSSLTGLRLLGGSDKVTRYRLISLCFVLSGLGHLIHHDVNTKRWKGIRLSRYGPLLSHLFFADDLVLFSEASQDQIEVIKEFLEVFSVASGQKVSLSKSHIFFSKRLAGRCR